jgi:hypothetical protein
MPKQSVVRVVGPLAPYASGFGRELQRRGYTTLSVAGQLRLMAHVSRWLAAGGLEAAAFTPERVEAFCTARRAEGYRGCGRRRRWLPCKSSCKARGCCPGRQHLGRRARSSSCSSATRTTSSASAV